MMRARKKYRDESIRDGSKNPKEFLKKRFATPKTAKRQNAPRRVPRVASFVVQARISRISLKKKAFRAEKHTPRALQG